MTCPNCMPKWKTARDVLAAHRTTLVRLRDEAAHDEISAGMRRAMHEASIAVIDDKVAALDAAAADADRNARFAGAIDNRWRGQFEPATQELA